MAQPRDKCPEVAGLQNPRQTPHSAITQKWPPMRFPVRVTPLGGRQANHAVRPWHHEALHVRAQR